MKPKILMVITEDWYFVSHRIELAIAAISHGYEVVLATRIDEHREQIEKAGIRIVPLELSRRSGNPICEILKLFHLYRNENPDIIHHVAIKPVIYGSIAAYFAGTTKWVNAIAGLGWLFNSRNLILRILRPMISRIFGWIINSPKSITVVQNPDDSNMLEKSGVEISRIRIIRGAGVDVEKYKLKSDNTKEGLPVVMLAARLLWEKGVGEFVQAAEFINSKQLNAIFVIVGKSDTVNPGCIPPQILQDWNSKTGIEWWGYSDNMTDTYAKADIACLPSYYGEGLPKSLLEAAASSLPIVTTDMPGCRETVIEGENGFIVPARNVPALVKALQKLVNDRDLINQMGAKSRELAECEFNLDKVIKNTMGIYSELLK